jgi:polysaccharide biosynthesis protein PslG
LARVGYTSRAARAPRPWRAAAVGLATAVIVLGAPACGGEQEASEASDFFGVNGVILRAWSSQGRSEVVERHLDQIEAAGLGSVRATLGWQRIEPLPPVGTQHHYEFADPDRWMTALASRGLSWSVMGLGVPTPAWAADPSAPAACGGQSPPARPEDLASILGAVAERYGSSGAFWRQHPELPFTPIREYEIWNAPNNGGDWCPTPDPEAYADLYARTRDEIHAADPDATVVVGGLGAFDSQDPGSIGSARMAPDEFLRRMLAARPELVNEIDAVGIHVYAIDEDGVRAGVEEFRQILNEVGLASVPMSWNEVGWPTQGLGGFPPKTETERAKLIGESTAIASTFRCGLTSFAPHTWVTPELDPQNPEDWFGLADPLSGEPYPSAVAYASAVEATESARGQECDA